MKLYFRFIVNGYNILVYENEFRLTFPNCKQIRFANFIKSSNIVLTKSSDDFSN